MKNCSGEGLRYDKSTSTPCDVPPPGLRETRACFGWPRRRFHAADLGPEFYPENPAALVRSMSFHPGQSSGTSTVHLPRHLNLFDPRSLDEIVAFARSCGPGVRGMIVHDQPDVAGRFEEYVRQVRVLDKRLEEGGPGPLVFIEYAVGLEVPRFVELFEAVRDCERISACIDISHIAIRECQRAYCPVPPWHRSLWHEAWITRTAGPC